MAITHMSPLNNGLKSSSYSKSWLRNPKLVDLISICEFGDNRSCLSVISDTQHEMIVYHSVTFCGFFSSSNWIMSTRRWHRGDTRQRELIILCKTSPETQIVSTTQPKFVLSSGNTLPPRKRFFKFSQLIKIDFVVCMMCWVALWCLPCGVKKCPSDSLVWCEHHSFLKTPLQSLFRFRCQQNRIICVESESRIIFIKCLSNYYIIIIIATIIYYYY